MLSAVLLCMALVGGAAAAEPLTVQLDGQPVVFTDAEPEIVNDRTFLPYRAIFETLGAQVSYEEDTRTAVAVRGGVTVRVPIGSTEVTILEDGVSRTLEMDVASYIKNGRTYVPVRFMAQALGCLVGWDGDDRTVILIDAEKLAEKVTAGYSYGNITRYHELLAGFQNGNWSVEGTMVHWVAADGVRLITTEASYSGLTNGRERMQMYLSMESDRSAWYAAAAAMLNMTLEEYGVTEDDLYAELEMEVRSDTGTGETYVCVAQAAGAGAALPVGTWLSMSTQTELAGVDLTALLCVEGDTSVVGAVKSALAALELNDRDTAMMQAYAAAETLAANMSDLAMRSVDENVRATRWSIGNVLYELTMTLDEERSVTAFALSQTMTDETGTAVSYTRLDTQGNVAVEMTVTAEGQTTFVRQSGRYTPSNSAPETVPPKGAVVTVYGE